MAKQGYLVRSEYTGENGMLFEAYDHEDAAIEYGEWSDLGEYSILAGASLDVSVEGPEGTIKKFRVSGESVPRYFARELE